MTMMFDHWCNLFHLMLGLQHSGQRQGYNDYQCRQVFLCLDLLDHGMIPNFVVEWQLSLFPETPSHPIYFQILLPHLCCSRNLFQELIPSCCTSQSKWAFSAWVLPFNFVTSWCCSWLELGRDSNFNINSYAEMFVGGSSWFLN
jgi:hypothetical protein